MEFLTEKEDEWGPPVALSDKEIDNLFKLAKVSKSDVFYDLGSGSQEIPNWVKSNACWWSQGLISNSDFASGLQYLIGEGRIRL